MSKILLLLLTFMIFPLHACADEKQEALDFFNKYVESANNYSPAVAEM